MRSWITVAGIAALCAAAFWLWPRTAAAPAAPSLPAPPPVADTATDPTSMTPRTAVDAGAIPDPEPATAEPEQPAAEAKPSLHVERYVLRCRVVQPDLQPVPDAEVTVWPANLVTGPRPCFRRLIWNSSPWIPNSPSTVNSGGVGVSSTLAQRAKPFTMVTIPNAHQRRALELVGVTL